VSGRRPDRSKPAAAGLPLPRRLLITGGSAIATLGGLAILALLVAAWL